MTRTSQPSPQVRSARSTSLPNDKASADKHIQALIEGRTENDRRVA